MRRRVGRPGLMGLAARTAVVAGTASAVSGSVSRKAQARSQQEAEAEAYRQQQAAAAQPAPPPLAPPAPTGDGVIEALERLATLHAQGILTDEELAQQKARILNG
ncbi:MAG: SHOCT domain-containing protein [Microlunatus sp.]|nr:SHOCT domain-containing protein [Microlunatus sp.]